MTLTAIDQTHLRFGTTIQSFVSKIEASDRAAQITFGQAVRRRDQVPHSHRDQLEALEANLQIPARILDAEASRKEHCGGLEDAAKSALTT